MVEEVIDHISKTSRELRRWVEIYPCLSYLLRPVDEWIIAQEIPPLLPLDLTNTSVPTTSGTTNTLINSFLVIVQGLISRCPHPTSVEQADDDDYILQGYHAIRDFTDLLKIDAITTMSEGVLFYLTGHAENVASDLRRILPFLEVYIGLVKDQLTTHSHWTIALFKLNFVLCSVMLTLAKEGFCQPPDTAEQEAGEDACDASGGVGLGEGSGAENMSKEIEEESQVEGLQGDDGEGQRPKDDKGDNETIEMSEEFAGEMEDVPDAGSEDENRSDHESDVDPEEKLEGLDPSDPSAVDEKLWGDEKGPEDGKEMEKIDQDRSKEQSGESEVIAKEGENKPPSKKKPAEDSGGGKPQDLEEEPVPENPEVEEEGSDANGAPVDDYVQDANTLDLPDDMDIGGDDIDLGGVDELDDAEGDHDDDHTDDKMEDAGPDQPDDTQADKWPGDQEDQLQDDIQEAMDQKQDEEQPRALEANPDEDMENENSDDKKGEEAIARPNISSGDGMTSPDETQKPDHGDNLATAEGGSSEGATGQDTAPYDEARQSDRWVKIPSSVSQFNTIPADCRKWGNLLNQTPRPQTRKWLVQQQPESKRAMHPPNLMGSCR